MRESKNHVSVLGGWCEKFLNVVVMDNPLLCVVLLSAAQCQAAGLLV